MELLIYQNGPNSDGHFIIFLGHYNVPEYSNTRLSLNGRLEPHTKLLTDASEKKPVHKDKIKKVEPPLNSVGVQTEFEEDQEQKDVKVSYANETITEFVTSAYSSVKLFINLQENQGLKLTLIVLVGCIIAMFWYLQMQVK